MRRLSKALWSTTLIAAARSLPTTPRKWRAARDERLVRTDRGVDRAVQDGGAQPGEEWAAVDQDEVELASEPGQDGRPGRTGNELARAGDRGAEGEETQVVVRRVDQRIGEKDVFYFRYSQGNYSTRSQFFSQPTLDWNKVPSGTQGYKAPNKNAAISCVHTFSPTVFNELVVSPQAWKVT